MKNWRIILKLPLVIYKGGVKIFTPPCTLSASRCYNGSMKRWLLPLVTTKRLGSDLLEALLIAAGFSAFLYLAHWGYTFDLFNTVAGVAAIWGLLTRGRRTVVLAGFFIGLLWFYWVGFSFRYYGMGWAIPFVSLGFALGYALIFGTMALTKRVWLRAFILFGIGFFEPFDFNWMLPGLLFVHSWLGVETWQFALLLGSITLFASTLKPWRYASIVLLLGAVDYGGNIPKALPPLSIKLVSASLPQEAKWVPANRDAIVETNFRAIEAAAAEGYDLVILHESAFPLFLNRHADLMERLRTISRRIAIVTGGLYYEGGQNYNVTYLFEEGNVRVAKKMVLVPFGEYIPLPAFLHKIVNDLFFDGAPDYIGADEPTTLTIGGVPFRNAVCYEATCPELFEGEPKYMIAISNNAWFTPSVESTLQRLLMEYFSKRHGTVIFHAANMAGTGVIR